MNLEKWDMKTLLLAAIKSEIESKKVYESLANRVKNALLKDRFMFLANEEDKHRAYLEALFKKNFPEEKIVVPEHTPVPIPEIDASEDRLLSEIIEDAMKAELAAKDFYESLKDIVKDEENKKMLHVLANMEQGHYDILAKELENLKQFEDYDTPWYDYSGL
jgi:rubrerythrin